jgi:hypothetical protein
MAAVGETYGKWIVIELYELEGVTWAVVKNSRNEHVKSRLPASDLASLNGSA